MKRDRTCEFVTEEYFPEGHCDQFIFRMKKVSRFVLLVTVVYCVLIASPSRSPSSTGSTTTIKSPSTGSSAASRSTRVTPNLSPSTARTVRTSSARTVRSTRPAASCASSSRVSRTSPRPRSPGTLQTTSSRTRATSLTPLVVHPGRPLSAKRFSSLASSSSPRATTRHTRSVNRAAPSTTTSTRATSITPSSWI
jgi:hypothetical protein